MLPARVQDASSHDVALSGDLSEFREALLAEIEAARKQSSANAVPLSNGQRIGRLGTTDQYRFSIESFLNMPGEMPGDLILPGHPPVPATVIGIEGLQITLSVEVDLPKFIPSASLRTDLTFLLRKLIERIEARADRANPAGDRICGKAPVSCSPEVAGESECQTPPKNPSASPATSENVGTNSREAAA